MSEIAPGVRTGCPTCHRQVGFYFRISGGECHTKSKTKKTIPSDDLCFWLVTRRRFELRTPCLKGSSRVPGKPGPLWRMPQTIEITGFAGFSSWCGMSDFQKTDTPAYSLYKDSTTPWIKCQQIANKTQTTIKQEWSKNQSRSEQLSYNL